MQAWLLNTRGSAHDFTIDRPHHLAIEVLFPTQIAKFHLSNLFHIDPFTQAWPIGAVMWGTSAFDQENCSQ
jgi:hypothetical protein